MLFAIVLFVIVRRLPDIFTMPPPAGAVFPEIVVLSMVILVPESNSIPPPPAVAWLFEIIDSEIVVTVTKPDKCLPAMIAPP